MPPDLFDLKILILFLIGYTYIAIWLIYLVYYLPSKKAVTSCLSEEVNIGPYSEADAPRDFLAPIMKWTKKTYRNLLIVASVTLVVALAFIIPGITEKAVPRIEQKSLPLIEHDTVEVRQLTEKASALIPTNVDTAILLLQKALAISKKYDLPVIEVKVLSQLAISYIRKGDFDNTVRVLDTAFSKVQAVTDPDQVAVLYNAAAIIYQQNGKYTKSIYNYFEGLNTLKENGLGKSLRAAKMYSNLAGLFILLEEPEQALQFLEEAKAILNPEDAEHRTSLAYVLCNSGIAKAAKGETGATEELYRSLELAKGINDPYISNKILINLAEINLDAGNYDLMEKQLDEAYAMAKKTKNPISVLLTNYGIGHAQLVRKNYKDAVVNLEKAFHAANEIGFTDAQLNLTKNLKQAYASLGNYTKAFAFQELYEKRKEEVQRNQKKQTFDILMQYQAAEKDKQIAQSQLEITQQESRLQMKNIWIGVFVVGTILLLVLLLIMLNNYRNKQKLQNQQIKNVEQQRAIERLSAAFEGEERERTRISRDIHDGVMSTFATVRMRIKKLEEELPDLSDREDYKNTVYLFDKATTELRMTAHNLMPDLLLEEGLNKAVYYYAKSIEENTGVMVTMQSFGTPNDLPQKFVLFLYRAIQELIQNVVKHAQASQVLIQIIYGNEALNITVEDNGKGLQSNNEEGLGIKSLRNRTKLYNGTLNIESKPGEGTSVTLDFVLQM